jgi:hypothetical protein
MYILQKKALVILERMGFKAKALIQLRGVFPYVTSQFYEYVHLCNMT